MPGPPPVCAWSLAREKKNLTWAKAMEKFAGRVEQWRGKGLGLHYEAYVYNVFCHSVLSFVAQFEHPPEWALKQERASVIRLARGPTEWAKPEDLWRRKEDWGQAKSFQSLTHLAKAAKDRVFHTNPSRLLEEGFEAGAKERRNRIKNEDEGTVGTRCGTNLHENAILLNIVGTDEDFHRKVMSDSRFRRFMDSGGGTESLEGEDAPKKMRTADPATAPLQQENHHENERIPKRRCTTHPRLLTPCSPADHTPFPFPSPPHFCISTPRENPPPPHSPPSPITFDIATPRGDPKIEEETGSSDPEDLDSDMDSSRAAARESKMEASSFDKVKKKVQKNAYSLLLDLDRPQPVRRARHKIELFELRNEGIGVMHADTYNDDKLSRRMVHSLHLLSRWVTPRVRLACLSTSWNRWRMDVRYQMGNKTRPCCLECGLPQGDSLRHYSSCRVVWEVGQKMLRLNPEKLRGLHSFILCSPEVSTKEELISLALLVYATYMATNHFRLNPAKDPSEVPEAIKQWIREAKVLEGRFLPDPQAAGRGGHVVAVVVVVVVVIVVVVVVVDLVSFSFPASENSMLKIRSENRIYITKM